ncbi:MAG TPA: hypothetical protein VIM71_06370 [Lacunisphaera sp.]
MSQEKRSYFTETKTFPTGYANSDLGPAMHKYINEYAAESKARLLQVIPLAKESYVFIWVNQ